MDERAAGLEKVMEFERMGGTLGSTGAYPSGRRVSLSIKASFDVNFHKID